MDMEDQDQYLEENDAIKSEAASLTKKSKRDAIYGKLEKEIQKMKQSQS